MPRDFTHYEDGETKQKTKRKAKLLFCKDINELSDPDYLVEDFLPKQGVVALYGQPGSKKGFVIVDLVMTIGALTAAEVKAGKKLPWHGKEVEHGAVLYVWAEGQGGIKKRVTAWRQMQQRLTVGHSVAILDMAFNLRNPEDVGELIALAKEAAESLGLPIKMVVLDTLSKCSGGANINAPGEMNELVDGMERLKTEIGALIAVIHHEGKDDSKGMMGATNLKGAIDAEFKVKSVDEIVTVEGGKTKDDAPANFTFKTRVVDVVNPVTQEPMLTKKGKRVTTLTLTMAEPSESAGQDKGPNLTKKQENALQAFYDWLNDRKATAMPLEEWTPLMIERAVAEGENARKRAADVRDQLDSKGLIRIEKKLIHIGRKAG